jgi:hypothetical protein
VKVLSLVFNAAGDQLSWKPDRDYKLLGATVVTEMVVSGNPSLVLADLNAAAAKSLRSDVLFYANFNQGGAIMGLNIPILKGQTIYFVSSAQETNQIYLV